MDEKSLGGYYYEGLETTQERQDTTLRTLWGYWSSKPIYKHEEHRTICGCPIMHFTGYINGDEISENMFTVSLDKYALRVGHNDTYGFYEDSRVVDKIKTVATQGDLQYNFTDRSEPLIDERSCERGIGNFVRFTGQKVTTGGTRRRKSLEEKQAKVIRAQRRSGSLGSVYHEEML